MHNLQSRHSSKAPNYSISKRSSKDPQIPKLLLIEYCLLPFRKGDADSAISVLTQCSLALSRSSSEDLNPLLPYLSESYILLGQWLQKSSAPLKNISTLKELTNLNCDVNRSTELDCAVIVQKLMERACQFSPCSPEAWLALGHFLYTEAQARNKYDSFLPELLREVLAEHDLKEILSSADDLKGNMEQVLENDSVLSKKPAVLKRVLIEYRNRRAQAGVLYCQATEAFFTFLNVRGSWKGDAHCVDVTLRILRTLTRNLCNNDDVMSAILEKGIDRTDSGQWRSLLPQLFSLMQRGKPCFRSLISKLLGRMAVDWPHLLLFPAAVGAAGLAWSWTTEQMEVAEDRRDCCTAQELQDMYEQLMGTLTKQVIKYCGKLF